MKNNTTTALVITDDIRSNPFSVSVCRMSAGGNKLGQRLSFVGGVPAGDVRKSLKSANPDLKGKALSKEVNKVLRGDVEIANVMLDLTIAHAKKVGFRPIVADMNKAQTKLTLKLEKVEGVEQLDKATIQAEAVKQLTVEELQALIAAKQEQAAQDKALDVGGTAKQDGEEGQPTPEESKE